MRRSGRPVPSDGIAHRNEPRVAAGNPPDQRPGPPGDTATADEPEPRRIRELRAGTSSVFDHGPPHRDRADHADPAIEHAGRRQSVDRVVVVVPQLQCCSGSGVRGASASGPGRLLRRPRRRVDHEPSAAALRPRGPSRQTRQPRTGSIESGISSEGRPRGKARRTSTGTAPGPRRTGPGESSAPLAAKYRCQKSWIARIRSAGSSEEVTTPAPTTYTCTPESCAIDRSAVRRVQVARPVERPSHLDRAECSTMSDSITSERDVASG